MKCEEIKELLTEYLDGELPAGDAASVEEHAAECEACRAELEALRQTSALLKSLPRADAPAGLAQNVAASLDRQITARRRAAALRWMHVGGWLSAAAAIIIMINLAPWESPPDSTKVPEHAASESARVEEESPAKDAAVAPGPPEAGLRREAAPKDAEFLRVAKPRPDDVATRMSDKSDAADEGDYAPAGHDNKLEGAAAPGVAAGKGGAVESVAVRAKVARGGTPSKETAEAMGRAMKKGRTSAKTKNDLAAKNKAAGPGKASAPLTLTYACKDVKAGRADVLKALKAAQGAPRDADKEAKADDNGDVIAARVPLGKLPGLVAALKLSGWSPPKTAPARKANEAGAVQSQKPAQLDAAAQARVRQPVQPAQSAGEAVADQAEQDLRMITINIILEVVVE